MIDDPCGANASELLFMQARQLQLVSELKAEAGAAEATNALLYWFINVSALCLLSTSGGAAETAAIRATSRSLTQNSITRSVAGVGDVTTFFTTYDGTSGLPLFDTNSASFSGELRPRAGQPGTYEGDYINWLFSRTSG